MTHLNLPFVSTAKHETNLLVEKKSFSFSSNNFQFFSKRFIRLVCVVIFSLVAKFAVAQPGQLDLSFNSNDNGANIDQGADKDVRTIVVQSDNKILIGGLFNNYNGTAANYFIRINEDGTRDAGFNAGGSGPNGNVYKIALQDDGKIIVAGAFTTYNAAPANHIIRLNADGSPDGTFTTGTGFNADVLSLKIQGDGKILIGGSFTNYNTAAAKYLVRLAATGIRDPAFIADATIVDSTVNDIAIQSNGKIIIGKDDIPFGVPQDYIARLNSNGTNNATFNIVATGINSSVKTIVLQADEKILVGAGGHYPSPYEDAVKLIRLNTNGTIDAGFNNASDQTPYNVKAITLLPDGKILAGFGISRTIFSEDEGQKLNRLNTDGTIDVSFHFDFVRHFNENVYAIALQNDNKILIGETYISAFDLTARDFLKALIYEGSRNFKINRYNTDGSREQSFCINPSQTGANRTVYTTIAQPDGKILIGGNFFNYNGTSTNYLTRLNADGSKDTSFNNGGTGPNSTVLAIKLQPDGKILIGGVFSSYNGVSDYSIVRLNPNGTLDPTFTFDVTFTGYYPPIKINTFALQPDGKILVGGYNDFSLFRLNSNGVKDNSFVTNNYSNFPQINYYVSSIDLQPDGKIIAGGQYASNHNAYLARFNVNGTNDTTWNQNAIGTHGFTGAGPNGPVRVVKVQPDGTILIAGEFNSYTTNETFTTTGYLARLNSIGEVDPLFNPAVITADNYIMDLIQQPDGKLVVTGGFTTYGGNTAKHFARLNADGSFDPAFNVGAGPTAPGNNILIYKIAPTLNYEKIMVAGNYINFNNIQRTNIARLYNNTHAATTNAVICASELPYIWNGNSYNASGVYTAPVNGGFDTLILTVGAGNITGPDRACLYLNTSTNATYQIVVPAGSTITWTVSNTSTMQVVGGQGTNQASIKFLPAFVSGYVYAKVVNAACGINVKQSLSVKTTAPSTPGSISTNSNTVCPFIGTTDHITYKINKVAGATSYIWNAQAGTTTITHPNGTGVNDTTINVVFANNFTTSAITVQAVNDCGTSALRSLTVTRSNPATPASITGPTDVCAFVDPGAGADYSITTIAGITYNWAATGGAIITNTTSGTGSTTIHVNFPAAFSTGTISVTASNGCGTSAERKLTVKVLKAATPAVIDIVNNSPCPTRVYTYSIPSFPANATSITWTVPAGATIQSGQGTISITVSYPSTQVSGYVSVQSFNNCSLSSVRKITINLPLCAPPNPFARSTASPENNMVEIHFDKMNVQVSPNPAINDFKLLVTTADNESITVKVFEVQGRLIREMRINANQATTFGSDLKAGTYAIEVHQGKNVKTERILKL